MSGYPLLSPELGHALVPIVSTAVNVVAQLVAIRYLGVVYYRSVVFGFVLGCGLAVLDIVALRRWPYNTNPRPKPIARFGWG